MNRWSYIVRRLLLLVLVLFGISIITFIVVRLVPSDPAAMYVGGLARPEAIARAEEELGLDKPLYQQYAIYLRDTVGGDWGTSLTTKRPVLSDILHFLPASLQLVTLAMLLAVVLGIPLGIASARWEGSWIDHVGRLVAVVGVSFASFSIAILLQVVFCRGLDLLPVAGAMSTEVSQVSPINEITGFTLLDALISGNTVGFRDALAHMILPALAIAAYPAGVIARMTRSTMLETLETGFVRMERAGGIPERWITGKWALKPAMGPVATVIGLTFAYALIGTFYVEMVFSYPGLGQYTVNAITSLDYPIIMGVTLLIAGVYVVVNLLVDLVLAWLDPRVVLE